MSFADYPLKNFPGGTYLGEGRYTLSQGKTGTYSSFADLDGDDWLLSYIRHDKPLSYQVHVNFTSIGFFSAQILEEKDGIYELHAGQGYCGSNQCHLHFKIDGREVEETITFLPEEKRIFRLGSLTYTAANGQPQVVSWEERMTRIPSRYGDEFKR